MSVRTIQYAAKHGIVLSENEVGTLFIKHSDIDSLRALHDACEQVLYKIEHELNCMQRELKFRKEKEVYRSHLGELFEPRSPIRHITTRLKTYESLFTKLVEKEEEMDRQLGKWIFVVDNIYVNVENLGKFSERQGLVRGPAYMLWNAESWIPPSDEDNSDEDKHKEKAVSADVYISGRFGFLGDASRAYFGKQKGPISAQRATITPASSHNKRRNKPLVWRILNLYMVDDISGVRIECDYLSDIETVLDALRTRYGSEQKSIRIEKIDKAIETPKPGGYRGIHLTVGVKIKDLIPDKDKKLLSKLLEKQEHELTLPCEIQIRTGYQQSWSEKSHDLTYKKEKEIPRGLLEPIRLLADQLYEADELSDVVRGSIEERFLPDFGERRLLNYLWRKLTREGFAFVEFGLQCAKERHKGDLRYGGNPHFSHILDICQKMVFRFEVLNSELLFLVALHDIWMGEKDNQNLTDVSAEGIRKAFIERIDREFNFLIQTFGDRLDLKRTWERDIPSRSWFWNILRILHWSWRELRNQRPGGEEERDIRRSRIRWLVNSKVPKEMEELDEETREYGLILEAALQLGRLEDLPDDPNPERREQEFRNFYKEFLLIRHGLPSSTIKTRIVLEAEQTFVSVARRLNVPIPITQIE